jgi:hypothetical protein
MYKTLYLAGGPNSIAVFFETPRVRNSRSAAYQARTLDPNCSRRCDRVGKTYGFRLDDRGNGGGEQAGRAGTSTSSYKFNNQQWCPNGHI